MNTLLCCFVLVFGATYQLVASFINFFVPRQFKRKKDIRGQRVLITGAGSGVGRHLAIQFSKHSTHLILVDINRQSLVETEKLMDIQSEVSIYECDVSDYRKVYEMAKKVKHEVGDVDILVNNAGIVSGKYLLDLTEEKIIKTMEVNALAHFWTTRAFLPAMMEKNRGHIVSIASIVAKCGGPKLTDYCTSKFAALGFAESLEMELREQGLDGIKVTIVCPYLIGTGMFQGAKVKLMGSVMTPEYAAKEVVLGVLEEQEIIFLPHFLRLLTLTNQIIPRWLAIKLLAITGSLRVMENFTGREPSKPVKTD